MRATWIKNQLRLIKPESDKITHHSLGFYRTDLIAKGEIQTYSFFVLDKRLISKTNNRIDAMEEVENKLLQLGFNLTIVNSNINED